MARKAKLGGKEKEKTRGGNRNEVREGGRVWKRGVNKSHALSSHRLERAWLRRRMMGEF